MYRRSYLIWSPVIVRSDEVLYSRGCLAPYGSGLEVPCEDSGTVSRGTQTTPGLSGNSLLCGMWPLRDVFVLERDFFRFVARERDIL